MSTSVTLDAVVVSPSDPHVLGAERGTTFWVRTCRGAWPEVVQVFLSVRHAELVDEVDLRVGAELRIVGELRGNGILAATGLTRLPTGAMAFGWTLGTVDLPVPALARLNPWRARRHQLILWGGLSVVVGLGLVGMVTNDNAVGGPAFLLFLALCAWLVASDLHGRRVDRREYGALARTARELIRAELHVAAPEDAMFTMLGGGLERTGNPWQPTRPNRPRAVAWGSDLVDGGFRAHVTPVPLQPGTTATITVTLLPTRY